MIPFGSLLSSLAEKVSKRGSGRSEPNPTNRRPPAKEPPNQVEAPYKYPNEIDLQTIGDQCFDLTGVRPRQFQLEAAQAALTGKDCILNVPTGGGKTLAFCLPVLVKKGGTVLVVSPLTALMKDQTQSLLRDYRIEAVAICKETLADSPGLFKRVASGTIPVVFISPEVALAKQFQQEVLSKPTYARHLINVVIDEGHCVTEWGGAFRPDYALLGLLRGRIRSGLAVTVATATLPRDISSDIHEKFRLSKDTVYIEMSNNRPNVALSVRPITHPLETFGDLAFLLPPGITSPQDIPCQLVYFNSRIEAEDAVDKLRSFLPDEELKRADCIAFYHSRIGEKRKRTLEEKLLQGEVRILCCTDAVGMGCDIRGVQKVVLWKVPPTFCALAQRAGRASRDLTKLGEAIVFVPKTMLSGAEEPNIPIGNAENPLLEPELEQEPDEGGLDSEGNRFETGENQDPEDGEPASHVATSGRAKKKPKSNVEMNNAESLKMFILTKECRRKVWDLYFENRRKGVTLPPRPCTYNLNRSLLSPQAILDTPIPLGARCCDRCQPQLFPIEIIKLSKASGRLKTGKRKHFMASTFDLIHRSLVNWRDLVLERDYPNCGFSMTAPMIISDANIKVLADCATLIRSIQDLTGRIHWGFTPIYGAELLTELGRLYDTLDWTTSVQPAQKKRRLATANVPAPASISAETDAVPVPTAAAATPAPGHGIGHGSDGQQVRGRGRGGRGRGSARGQARGRGQGQGRGRGRGSK